MQQQSSYLKNNMKQVTSVHMEDLLRLPVAANHLERG